MSKAYREPRRSTALASTSVGDAHRQRTVAGGGSGSELVERPVVPGPDDGAEHGRVERAPGEAPCVERPRQQVDRLRGHAHRLTGTTVELAHLAVGEEAAPSALEVVDPLLRHLRQ